MSVQITQAKIIEAILFASDIPVEMEKLISITGVLSATEILAIIDFLNKEHDAPA